MLGQLMRGARYLYLPVLDSDEFEDLVHTQIEPFIRQMPSEFVLLDLDVDGGRAEVTDILERHLSPDTLAATEFVNLVGGCPVFNPGVTLGDLRRRRPPLPRALAGHADAPLAGEQRDRVHRSPR